MADKNELSKNKKHRSKKANRKKPEMINVTTMRQRLHLPIISTTSAEQQQQQHDNATPKTQRQSQHKSNSSRRSKDENRLPSRKRRKFVQCNFLKDSCKVELDHTTDARFNAGYERPREQRRVALQEKGCSNSGNAVERRGEESSNNNYVDDVDPYNEDMESHEIAKIHAPGVKVVRRSE